jgi:hypothetical protein
LKYYCLLETCSCGNFESTRIVGGFFAKRDQYPYQVGLRTFFSVTHRFSQNTEEEDLNDFTDTFFFPLM